MKSYNKATVTICLLIWMFFNDPQAVLAMDVDDSPTSVSIDYMEELYQGVIFDHEMHTTMYSCCLCHHHTTGDGSQDESCKRCHANSAATEDVSCSGCHEHAKAKTASLTDKIENSLYHIDKPGLKGALHLQCLGCHRAEGGPTGCQDCHDFTPEGRKRFAVKD